MKKKGFAVIAMAVILGLAAQGKSVAGNMAVEKIPTAGGTIVTHAYASQREGLIEVAGKVSRSFPLHMPGHVDIFVYGPDGSLLGKAKKLLPGIMAQRKGRMDFPFSARFTFPAPEGSTVSVKYHGVPYHLAENCS